MIHWRTVVAVPAVVVSSITVSEWKIIVSVSRIALFKAITMTTSEWRITVSERRIALSKAIIMTTAE